MTPTPAPSATLKPYLPRLAIDWLATRPEDRWQALEGSVVFVDISGFTKMSERLAKRGKVGAEEVTDNLGSVFTRMLSVAYGEGGGLLKFGGDALLLWFGGEQHPERAVRSAHGMRAMLRQVGILDTSAGRVVLRMSVGVHSGTFHFFLVGGGSHREFMVTGPAASRTVDMEGTATAGEILLSPECAAHLPPNLLGKEKGPGVLLRSSPGGMHIVPRDGAEDATVDLRQAVPLAVREHVLHGAAEPEHRQVVVGFIHFDEMDALVHERGPEAAAQALDELVTDAQTAADAHGVTFLATDVDHDGGKVILIAGAPRATGDDEERMLLTLRQVVARERTLPVRIGVNRGHVFVGEVGPAYRRTYTVMGDAVNLAARVMAKAVPGQLLATAPVLERSRTSFATEALEPFMVKGKAKPVQAYAVGEVVRKERPAGEGAARLPFVGRDDELARLREVLETARAGRGRLVEVVGDIGIGKSRLFDELRPGLDGFRVLEARAELYEESTPYFPWRRLLRHVVGLDEDAPPRRVVAALRETVERACPALAPWVPLLAEPFGLDVPDTPETAGVEEQFRRGKIVEIVRTFLEAVLVGPSLLRLEDAQWLDEPSCELLGGVAVSCRERPWVLLALSREAETGIEAPDPLAVQLEPLAHEAIVELVRRATEDDPLRSNDVALLAERSAGNPLFLRELLRATREAGGTADLPDSVESLVAAQIDHLGARERTLLRCASVLGNRFEADLATSVLREEVPEAGEDPLAPLGAFLRRDHDGIVRFGSALVRDVAYEGLPFKRRRALHARVGERIEAGCEDPAEHAGLLSFHFFHSDEPEKAWRYSLLAGTQAEDTYANVEAAEFLRRALTAARSVEASREDLLRVHELLGDVQERMGRYDDAATSYRLARRDAGEDAVEAARLIYKQADMFERKGKFRPALQWLRKGLNLIEGDDGEAALHVRAELELGYASIIRRSPDRADEALAWLDRAQRDAEACGDRRVLAHVAFNRDMVLFGTGRLKESSDRMYAVRTYEELGLWGGAQQAYANMGLYAATEGRWDEAASFYARAVDISRRRGDDVHGAIAEMNMGELLSDQGRLEEADERLREVLRIWRAADFREGVAHVLGQLARCASRGGRHDEAAELFEQARAIFVDIGDAAMTAEIDAKTAEHLLFRRQGAAGLALATDALERFEKLGGQPIVTALLHRMRGLALVQTGRREEGVAEIEAGLRVARDGEVDYEAGLALRDLVRLGVGDVHDEERESRAIFERLGVERAPEVPLPAPAR